MAFVHLILGVVVFGMVWYFIQYLTALALLWPRLIAKAAFMVNQREIDKYRKTKRELTLAQLALPVFGVLLTWAVVPRLVVPLLILAGATGGAMLLLQWLGNWIVGQVLGMRLIGRPPQAVVRELGGIYGKYGAFAVAPLTAMVVTLFIASNVFGLAMAIAGIVIAFLLREHIPRTEDTSENTIDTLVNKLDDAYAAEREVVTALCTLRDLGGPEAVAALNQLLARRPKLFLKYDEIGLKVMEEIGDRRTLEILAGVRKPAPEVQSVVESLEAKFGKVKHRVDPDTQIGLLIGQLRDADDEEEVKTAFRALQNSRSPQAVAALNELLDEDPDIFLLDYGEIGLKALRKVGDRRTLEILRRLEDPEPEVKATVDLLEEKLGVKSAPKKESTRLDPVAEENSKVPCRTCGHRILPATADETGGLCMPCYRKRAEP